MTIHEPMTVLTDYFLAVVATVFAVRLYRAGIRYWSLAFFATAAASFLGGTYHGIGFAPLWKATVLVIGLASLLLLAGLGRGFAIFGALKFGPYTMWMAVHDDFKYVIYDYGLTLIIVAVVGAIRRNWWLPAGVAVSALAAAVQQSGFALHRHFNHNDLYHLIQIVGLWLLYRGGLLLRKWWTDRPTSPPT
jgi:hypothetical protein